MPENRKQLPKRQSRGLFLWLCFIAVVGFGTGMWFALQPAPRRPGSRSGARGPAPRKAPPHPPRLASRPGPGTVAPPPHPAPARVPAPLPTAVATAGEPGKLAIVIDDCGNSPDPGVIDLGVPITVSVLPHVPYAHQVARRATAHGDCVILHLPMESIRSINPGPGTLKTSMDDQQLQRQIKGDFDSVPDIVGVNNHEGSKASADPRVMRLVLAAVARRGLFYLDSRTTPRTVAPKLAPEAGVPLLSRDVFLDDVDSVAAVVAQLNKAERLADQRGRAIAIGHPHKNTLTALREWLPGARRRGIDLVLLPALLPPHHQAHAVGRVRTTASPRGRS